VPSGRDRGAGGRRGPRTPGRGGRARGFCGAPTGADPQEPGGPGRQAGPMKGFTSDEVSAATEDAGLLLPPFVVDQLVAAIDSGKHVILTGPPGTGKTTLAYITAEVAQQAMMCTGYLPTTATSEWTTFETIGGLQPTADGLIYRPGLFVDSIESGRWLVI